MTRRRILNLALGLRVGSVGCAPRRSRIAEQLQVLESRERLAILGFGLSGLTLSGKTAGKLEMPDLSDVSPERAVAPDAEWLSWLPYSLRGTSPTGGEPLLYVASDPQRIKPVRFQGSFCNAFAISSGGSTLALVSGGNANYRLFVLDVQNNLHHDMSLSATSISIPDVERLSLSAAGDRLAAGSRERFTVIDIQSGNRIFAAAGRFPTLSPDGRELAYVSNGRLWITELTTGKEGSLLRGCQTDGVGAWSPDGRLLLVGSVPRASLSRKLVVVHGASDEFLELIQLSEGDFANQCAWVKRRLLTQL
jgi:hypothetical protein